jgi:colanic acid/amylovoran biosynthesis glycosyltransferase
MKVAYIAPYYPHVSHSFIRREIAALERLGFTIERFSLRAPHSLVDPSDRAEAAKTTVLLAAGFFGLLGAALRSAIASPIKFWRAFAVAVRCGRRSERGVIRHLIYLAEACHFKHQVAQRDVQHVHGHFGTNAATVAMLSHTLGGPPFSFTVHGPEEFDLPRDLALDWKIASANFVVAISSFGRSQLMRWCAAEDWPKIHVVHCGVDESFLRAETKPIPNNHRLVCVGRLCEQKGQLLLIEALAELTKAGMPFELVLAGDGPMRPAIEASIERHSLRKHVRITGWISGDQVRRELEASRALVLPSFAEGLPVVIMEALALGRPVVSTFVAGIPELVRNGIEGWLVPAGSVSELVAALRCALTSPVERLAEMGRSGASRVTERHDVAKETNKLAPLFGK